MSAVKAGHANEKEDFTFGKLAIYGGRGDRCPVRLCLWTLRRIQRQDALSRQQERSGKGHSKRTFRTGR